MFIRKLLFHIKGYLVMFWYKFIYRSRLKLSGLPSVRKDLSVMIGKAGEVRIGKGCFFNNHCSINCEEAVSIGDNCLFGEGVKIYDSDHRFRNPNLLIKDQGNKCASVTIGNNCWLGSNVIVLKGTTIGSNSVVGGGCVVSGHFPAGSIVKMKRKYEVEARYTEIEG